MFKKPLVLLASLMLTLAITAGIYAYTYTTITSAIGVTSATGDFAAITSNMTVPPYKPFGKQRGAISAGNLFNVTPTTSWAGDLEVVVTLSNPEELVRNYRSWNLRLRLVASDNTTVDAQGITQLLSLDQPVAQFYFPSANFSGGTTYYVQTTGGSFAALPWIRAGWPSTYQPLLFGQVTQAGP